MVRRWGGSLGRRIPGELWAGLCSPPRAPGSVGMDLNTQKECVWKLPFGGGLWLTTQNHIKWARKSITRILNSFQYFSAVADYQSSFLLIFQGVLNRQRFLGLKDAPVFPSFVKLRAVKGRDAFTWGNHSTTLLSSFLLFAIVILLFLLKTGADGFPFTSEN